MLLTPQGSRFTAGPNGHVIGSGIWSYTDITKNLNFDFTKRSELWGCCLQSHNKLRWRAGMDDIKGSPYCASLVGIPRVRDKQKIRANDSPDVMKRSHRLSWYEDSKYNQVPAAADVVLLKTTDESRQKSGGKQTLLSEVGLLTSVPKFCLTVLCFFSEWAAFHCRLASQHTFNAAVPLEVYFAY